MDLRRRALRASSATPAHASAPTPWNALVLAALLLAMLPVAARAVPTDHDELPPNWIGGSLTANRTLTAAAPGPLYIVYGDLTVQPGVTLTVEPGVTVAFQDHADFFASGGWHNRCELIVRGTLNAVGTAGDSIDFRSVENAADAWGEIRVDGGQATIAYAQIAGPVNGVAVSGTGGNASITSSHVAGSSTGVSSTATVHVGACRVAAGGIGIYATNGNSDLLATDVTGVSRGIYIGGVNSRIRSCKVHDSGVGIEIGRPIISFQPDDSTNAVPTEVWNCGIGVRADEYIGGGEGPLTLKNLLVHHCSGTGIAISRVRNVTIDYCTVAHCGEGVNTYQPSATSGSATRILNSILAYNTTALIRSTCLVTVDYTDLWTGPSVPGGCPFGSHVAVFDPGFVNPGVDYHLSGSSLFGDYSASGGAIGAYGPGAPGSTAGVVPVDREIRFLSVSPNPSRGGNLRIQLGAAHAGITRVQVLDLAGRVVRARTLESRAGTTMIDLATDDALAPGMYLVRVEHRGRTATAKATLVQ